MATMVYLRSFIQIVAPFPEGPLEASQEVFPETIPRGTEGNHSQTMSETILRG